MYPHPCHLQSQPTVMTDAIACSIAPALHSTSLDIHHSFIQFRSLMTALYFGVSSNVHVGVDIERNQQLAIWKFGGKKLKQLKMTINIQLFSV